MNLASLVVTIGEGQVGPPFSAPPRQTERDDFLGGLSRARSKYVALLVAFAVSAASSSAEAIAPTPKLRHRHSPLRESGLSLPEAS
jgi:hypothetical protein